MSDDSVLGCSMCQYLDERRKSCRINSVISSSSSSSSSSNNRSKEQRREYLVTQSTFSPFDEANMHDAYCQDSHPLHSKQPEHDPTFSGEMRRKEDDSSIFALEPSKAWDALRDNALARQILASSLGTSVSVLALNPVSVVKIMLQRQQTEPDTPSNLSATSPGSLRSLYLNRSRCRNTNAINSSSSSSLAWMIRLSRGSAEGGKSLLGVGGSEATVLEVVRGVWRRGGLRAFWAGAPTGLLQAVPSSVLYMTAYEHLKERLGNATAAPSSAAGGPMEGLRALVPGVAGLLARCYAASLIAPLELIKTVQAAGNPDGAGSIATNILRREGLRGLYKGLVPTLMRDAPFSAIYWMTFERLKALYGGLFGLDIVLVGVTCMLPEELEDSARDERDGRYGTTGSTFWPSLEADGAGLGGLDVALERASERAVCERCTVEVNPQPRDKARMWPLLRLDAHLLTFLSGATAGVLAAVITHPFDVLKTQRQLARPSSPAPQHPALQLPLSTSEMERHSEGSSLAQLRRMYQERGLRSLYKGLSMRLLTVIPSSAIMVTVYEFVKTLDW